MVAVSCDQLLDHGLFDRLLPVFYTQYLVAVLKIEVDPAMGEILFQEKENRLSSLFVRDVGPEYLDNFQHNVLLKNIEDACLDDAAAEIRFYR